MTTGEILIYTILFSILTVSIYSDWKYHKIYNWVTYSAIILGFIINSYLYGMDGFISCWINLIGVLVFFIVFYWLKMLGAGDIKLIMAIAVLMNIFYCFAGLIIGTMLAAMYGVYIWIKTKNKKNKIPYGIFIGIGFYLYQFFLWFLY